MSPDGSKNLGIVRGGHYGRRKEVIRECVNEARARLNVHLLGKRKSRKLGCVQAGITSPLTPTLELIDELKEARLSYEQTRHIVIGTIEIGLARRYGRQWEPEGEFDPPSAPAQMKKAA